MPGRHPDHRNPTYVRDAAAEVITAGLELAPGDWKFISDRGDVRAARGDTEGAVGDWRRAHDIDPTDFSTVYSSAFLLEDVERLEEAVESWQQILAHSDAQGAELDAMWPRQEIQRLERLLAERRSPGK